MELWHLTKRFFESLLPREPTPGDEAWLIALLSSSEEELYRDQSAIDRDHSIRCALLARDILGSRATRPVVVASALHDVGKVDARLGTFGRVVATVLGAVLPDGQIERWRAGAGFRAEVGAYLNHANRGAELLMSAGSDPMVVAWACEHHLPRSEWSIDAELGDALRRADG